MSKFEIGNIVDCKDWDYPRVVVYIEIGPTCVKYRCMSITGDDTWVEGGKLALWSHRLSPSVGGIVLQTNPKDKNFGRVGGEITAVGHGDFIVHCGGCSFAESTRDSTYRVIKAGPETKYKVGDVVNGVEGTIGVVTWHDAANVRIRWSDNSTGGLVPMDAKTLSRAEVKTLDYSVLRGDKVLDINKLVWGTVTDTGSELTVRWPDRELMYGTTATPDIIMPVVPREARPLPAAKYRVGEQLLYVTPDHKWGELVTVERVPTLDGTSSQYVVCGRSGIKVDIRRQRLRRVPRLREHVEGQGWVVRVEETPDGRTWVTLDTGILDLWAFEPDR